MKPEVTLLGAASDHTAFAFYANIPAIDLEFVPDEKKYPGTVYILGQYSHLSNKRDVTLTDFGKFHPAQNKNPPCTFIDFITKLSIFLQNLMKIFLTVILSYKSLF